MPFFFGRSDTISSSLAFEAISKIIDRGMEIMEPNIDEKMFENWFNYAKDVLKTVERSDISIGFLELSIDLMKKNASTYQKIDACIRYLIDALKKMPF